VPTTYSAGGGEFAIGKDGNNWLLIWEYEGTLYFQKNVAAAGAVTIGSVTYNPNSHHCVRFRESSGTIYAETSPNGATWTGTFSTSSVLESSLWSGCCTSGMQLSLGNQLLANSGATPGYVEFSCLGFGTSLTGCGGGVTNTSGTLSSGIGVLGTLAVNAVLASTVANVAGHFTNLQVVTSLGGTCTTVPIFNVFDGTSNVGSTVTAGSTTQTKGTGTSTAQTLTFAAGDVIGIYISTAGATCTLDQFVVSAQYSIP
jgi:hypothetical protein